MNIYFMLLVVAIGAFLALLYRHLMIRIMRSLHHNSAILVPYEQLKDITDFRQFFGFLNKFSFTNLNINSTIYKDIPSCFKVGPFHFLMAFSNLTEVQRSRFADNPLLLKQLIPIFSQYNNAIWNRDYKGIANALANYHRAVKGSVNREPSFFMTENFKSLLFQVKDALLENNIFKAHFLLQKRESDSNLTDFELILLNYLMARLCSYFQGKGYRYSQAANIKHLEELQKEVIKILNNIDNKPEEILCYLPDNAFPKAA